MQSGKEMRAMAVGWVTIFRGRGVCMNFWIFATCKAQHRGACNGAESSIVVEHGEEVRACGFCIACN